MRKWKLNRLKECRERLRFGLSVIFLLFCSVVSGCISIPRKNGTVHYLVVGFGIVSVNDAAAPAVTATNAHVLGISVSDRPSSTLAIGYSSSTVLTIADGAEDVRVEISKLPGRPIIVEAPSVKQTKNSNPEGERVNEGNK